MNLCMLHASIRRLHTIRYPFASQVECREVVVNRPESKVLLLPLVRSDCLQRMGTKHGGVCASRLWSIVAP